MSEIDESLGDGERGVEMVLSSSANKHASCCSTFLSPPSLLQLGKVVEEHLITSIIINWPVTRNGGRKAYLKNEIGPETFITIKLKKCGAGNKMLVIRQALVLLTSESELGNVKPSKLQ